VIKIDYLELFYALEGTLSCWSLLHLQSLAPTPVSRRVDVKIIAESLPEHDEKHVVPTPLSGRRVGNIGNKKKNNYYVSCGVRDREKFKNDNHTCRFI
jgi:hypothetical protein